MQHSYFPYEPTQQLRVDTQNREIKVIGEGSVSAVPNEISMTIGTRTENRDVQEALKENSAVSNTLLQEIKNLGINDQQIETASFTINPKYDYSDGKSTLTGYEVQHLFRVRVQDVKQAGDVYNATFSSGANVAQDLQFHVTNDDKYEQEAISKALLNAKEKAFTIANTLQLPINQIPILIEEGFVYQSSGSSPKLLAASPPIQAQSLTVSASVKVTYTY
jgi:uncharacterized protein